MSTIAQQASLEGFGERLVRIRQLRHLATQGAAAALVGANQNTYGSWEKGHAYPETGTLLRVAAAFGVTTDWLLTGSTAGLSQEAWKLVSGDDPTPRRGRGRRPKLSTVGIGV